MPKKHLKSDTLHGILMFVIAALLISVAVLLVKPLNIDVAALMGFVAFALQAFGTLLVLSGAS